VNEDDNGKLILSDKILSNKVFNDDGPHESTGKAYYNFWEESNIRSWLNSSADGGKVKWLCGNLPVNEETAFGHKKYPYADEKGFLHPDNFTQKEREVVKPVTQWTLLAEYGKSLSTNGAVKYFIPPQIYVSVSPTASRWEDDKDIRRIESVEGYMYELEDTVFLLDEMQVKKLWENFGTISDEPTEQAAILENARGIYWLRSPVCINSYSVRQAGGEYGYYYSNANIPGGVRPAFYLDETAAQIVSGSGTKEDPYVIIGKENNNIHVYCDWWELTFDVLPINEDGHVLVPMRKIFEHLGAGKQCGADGAVCARVELHCQDWRGKRRGFMYNTYGGSFTLNLHIETGRFIYKKVGLFRIVV
jgi:hypothetical protein